MRKLITILFSAFYLVTSVGVYVNIHYCTGEVTSVKILATDTDCCCVDAEKSAGCCDDETFLFQLNKEDQINQHSRDIPEPQLTVIASLINSYDHFKTIEKEANYEQLEAPPPRKQPIWLVNCSLTYYG